MLEIESKSRVYLFIMRSTLSILFYFIYYSVRLNMLFYGRKFQRITKGNRRRENNVSLVFVQSLLGDKKLELTLFYNVEHKKKLSITIKTKLIDLWIGRNVFRKRQCKKCNIIVGQWQRLEWTGQTVKDVTWHENAHDLLCETKNKNNTILLFPLMLLFLFPTWRWVGQFYRSCLPS